MHSILNRFRRCAAFLLLIGPACAAQSLPPVIEIPNPPNSAAAQAEHYVVLVSLDGFRYDYAEKYGAKNLLQLSSRGASAPQGMIPPYPSLTFPSHYTIVTGLYPEHHGLIANSFYDPKTERKFDYRDPAATPDGVWYGGTPLWSLAERQRMRSACFFWPGSEAEIQGKRPSYYLKFPKTTREYAKFLADFPDSTRVDQVLAWLKLPPKMRPHFITLYFYDVDHAGHQYGPDAPETGEAVRHVDDMIGRLSAGIATLNLPVDLIVVADHGMAASQGDWIALDKWVDPSLLHVEGPLMYPKSEADAETAYRALLGVNDAFQVYRRANVPRNLHFDSNPREGDPVIVPTGPFNIAAHMPNYTPNRGAHGYNPATVPSMKAIFYAAGPDIRPGVTVEPFENVNVYPLIAKILGLRIGAIDGKLNVLQGILAANSLN